MGRILFSWTLWKWLLVAAALILLPIFLMSYLGVDWMVFARTLRELFLSRS